MLRVRQVSKIGLTECENLAQRARQQRYFTRKELRQVFKLNDPNISKTQQLFAQFNSVMIGKNVEFDNEMQRLDLIDQVFGISHHDILFKLGSNGSAEDENGSIDDNVNGEIASIRESLKKQTLNIQQGSPTHKKMRLTMKKAENPIRI